MPEHPAHHPAITRVRGRLAHAQALVVLCVLGMIAGLRHRWELARESGDSGDVTQTAVLVAIGLVLAVGLAAAITTVVNKYQSMIK